jgi:hypothetical protein
MDDPAKHGEACICEPCYRAALSALSRAQEALRTVQHLLNLYKGMDAVTVARRLGGVREEIDAALAQPPSEKGE